MSGVGAQLREAREARGISLEQAERETRIIRRYIAALEADDLDVFPAEVYARGFLRSYANYLGLRPDDLLRVMPRSGPASPALEPRAGRQRTPKPGASPRSTAAARRQARSARPRPGLLVVFAACGLAVASLLGYAVGGDADPIVLPSAARVRPTAVGGDAPSGGEPVAGRMPDLVGMSEDEAVRQLTELGVTPFVVKAPSREAPAGQVMRQSPGRNAPIGSGVVTIVVSAGG
jgi:transcriptional regulator with XRE-family HTH domain